MRLPVRMNEMIWNPLWRLKGVNLTTFIKKETHLPIVEVNAALGYGLYLFY